MLLVVIAVILAVALVVVLDVAEVLDIAPESGGEAEDEDDAALTLRDLAGDPPRVLVMRSGELVRFDVEGLDESVLGELPTRELYPSPRTSLIAYVLPEGAGDNVGPGPELVVLDPGVGVREVGSGVSPLWRDDGRAFAYLRPSDPGSCVGPTCPVGAEVYVAEADSLEERRLLETGPWNLLTWAGEYLLVRRGNEKVFSVSPNGETQELDVSPGYVWGSPDGRWLVEGGSELTFRRFRAGEVVGSPIRVRGSGYQDPVWSPDSSRVAALSLLEGPRPVTFSPEARRPRPVGDVFIADSPLLWSVDGDRLLVTNVINVTTGERHAYLCRPKPDSACAPLMSWRKDRLLLLRME